MNWLHKIEPVILEQSSDVPYVVLEDGVQLCYDNMYYESDDHSDHHIKFLAHKQDLKRRSASCWRFRQFPTIIPFKDVLSLDDVVLDGKVIKIAAEVSSDPKSILVIRSKALNNMEEEEFQEVIDSIDEYDYSFLLTASELDTYDRLLADTLDIIHHRGWHHSCVAIADRICPTKHRKYCWTKNLPELSMTIYGLEHPDDLETVSNCFDDIGITEKEITWG